MSTSTRATSNILLSLPLPSPKAAPPSCPDLYGKRREMAKIQMLEREISFLEILCYLRARRTTGHVASGMTSLALTCLGSAIGAVMGALNIKTCQVVVPTACHAIAVLVVFHLPIALAALMEYHIAAKIVVVAKFVALSQVAILGGLFPLAAFANALALALGQAQKNVPRFVHVAVVQIPVGTPVHVSSIVSQKNKICL
ncbi:hypothetical protein JHK86_024340 [Glycine max]|nr:hypothetical protein JHK86_024340 [Glycine max]